MASINIKNQVVSTGTDGDDCFVFPKGSQSDGTNNTMAGGLGNDFYEVDSIDSRVIENANGGIDTVRLTSSMANTTYNFGDNVENAVVSANATKAVIFGNAGDNIIAIENRGASTGAYLYGGAGRDKLYGDASANYLNGGSGADLMVGGGGDDTYRVDEVDDQIIETDGDGYDRVVTTVSYTLSKNLEQLDISGLSTGNISVSGNELDNTINDHGTGNGVINGGGGNDSIYGGGGNDRLDGGSGHDVLADVDGNNTFAGGLGDDTITAGEGNDLIDGGAGNDTVSAGHGNNVISGGLGNDQLHTGSGSDLIDGGSGNDILIDWNDVQANWPIGNTLRGGDGNDLIIAEMNGNRGYGNTLEGGNGDDILVDNASSYYNANSQGEYRADVLNGGTGNDQYYLRIAQGIDKVRIIDTSGIDTIHIGGEVLPQLNAPDYGTIVLGVRTIDHVQLTLAAGIENLDASAVNVATYLVGNSSNNAITGSNMTDVLIGGAGNDTLDGKEGADNLLGGSGNDLYVIDNAGDTVVEEANGGVDTVWSQVAHKLSSHVENLHLMGSLDLVGNGNILDNTIIGNSGSNLLYGDDGNDVLDAGNDYVTDTLWGGSGNDTLIASAGADILYGGTGNDTYHVSNGAKAYEGNGEGTDSVVSWGDYYLGSNFENLTLGSGISSWEAFGNELKNYIKGNDGINYLKDCNSPILAGGDADILEGGRGNDIYEITWGEGGKIRDRIIEVAGGGIDSVILRVENLSQPLKLSLTSGELSQVEHLELGYGTYTGYTGLAFDVLGSSATNTITGSSANDRIDGGAGDDVIHGGSGHDTLIGGAGNDTLSGQDGSSTLDGGVGNDYFIVDSTTDVVIDSGGIDTIEGFGSFDLDLRSVYKGIENAIGRAQFKSVTLTGTDGANTLSANQQGTHVLEMIGGSGNDTYILKQGDATYIRVVETGTTTVGNFDTVITYLDRYALTDNVEKLILAGGAHIGYGNAQDNTLIGNAGSDTLDGKAGKDRMEGGAGDDYYSVDSTGDVIIENANGGRDTVYFWSNGTYTLGANVEQGTVVEDNALTGVNLVGNAQDNFLEGNSKTNTLIGGAGNDAIRGYDGKDVLDGGVGNDILDGGAGDDALLGGTGNDQLYGMGGLDYMAGGLGDDLYFVDSATEVIVELANGGIDSIVIDATATDKNYTLAGNAENLYGDRNTAALNFYGNDLNNTLVGNSLANILDGGRGTDFLLGGGGNDIYLVDGSSDFILDFGNDSADVVNAIGTSFNLASNGVGVERLYLDNGIFSVIGIGNSLNNIIGAQGTGSVRLEGGGGDDTLTGNNGMDTLFGGEGADTMIGGFEKDTLAGGLGNDTYWIDNQDVILEVANEGVDTIWSEFTYTLGANLENLTLLGSATVNGYGNQANNVLLGNSANNLLAGSSGNDILTGGTGADIFRFGEFGNTNADVITDFQVRVDHLQLYKSVFSLADGDNNGVLDATDFEGGYAGTDWGPSGIGNHHLSYNPDSGELWYSAWGNGLDKQLVAVFGGAVAPSLTATDILIV